MFTKNSKIGGVLWILLLIASSVRSRSILHPGSHIFPTHNTSSNASLSLNTFPDPYDLRIPVPNPLGMMLELYGYTSHVLSGDTWRLCRGAAFHAFGQPPNAPMDTQKSYVYSYGGVNLFILPDFDASGRTDLTWNMWGTAAKGLGTFVGAQHFDKQFQFMVLQDWPPGQQVTQRYVGHGAIVSNVRRGKGEEAAGATA